MIFHMTMNRNLNYNIAESWWVEALARNPVMIPYRYGHRRLDKIYLDTTYAAQKNLHQAFPTKAAGLSELLEKVSMYPKDTLFHFNAWTFGYEEVWTTLATYLRSRGWTPEADLRALY